MTNNKQQTAVEWLIERLLDLDIQFAKKLISLNVHSTTKVYLQEKAKEMEKEQNKNYLKSYFEWHKSMGFVSHNPKDIIEFNETCGGNK
jgi:hypothetical protein